MSCLLGLDRLFRFVSGSYDHIFFQNFPLYALYVKTRMKCAHNVRYFNISFQNKEEIPMFSSLLYMYEYTACFQFLRCPKLLRDAIHTHFVTLIGKWKISFLPTHPVFLSAFSRDVTKLLSFDLATVPRLSSRCLTHPSTIFHLPISVTKWVWMASHICDEKSTKM